MQAIVSSPSHDFTLSLLHTVCVRVCLCAHTDMSPNICVRTWSVQRCALSPSIHTLLSPHIEFSADTPHLLVQPAYECCYPVMSSMLTKRNIGF